MAAAGPSSIHHRVACRLATRAKPSASLKLGTRGHVGRSDDLRRWPTAAPTATPADRGGRRRAGAPEAPRSRTPTNGAELRKPSLKTEVTGPRGPKTGLAVRPFPRRKRSQPAAPPPAACQPGRWSPRTGLALHASWWPTRTPRSHFVRWGVLAKLGWDRGPPDPSSTKARPQTLPGGLVGAGYWGSSGRTLAAWGPLGPDVTSNSTAWPSSSER